MRVLSLFSGAGGMDLGLANAGMTHVGMCEIDPTARAVLARHWPDVPIWEDVTQLTADMVREQCGHVDMVAGGFPCQDLSVAGRRAGLAGGRSGLFWDALRIAADLGAEYLLLENVVGLLSSNDGEDFRTVLDAVQEAGYIADPNLYDARFFGVAQRRRRIFITCRLATATVNESTPRSWLTMGQVLVECWLLALGSVRGTSASAPPPWDSAPACVDGLTRRMKLFGLGTPEAPNFAKWLDRLADAHPSAATDGDESQTSAGDRHRGTSSQPTDATSSGTTPTVTADAPSGFWPTGQQWRTFLDDLSALVKLSTTSTATSETTERAICTSSVTLPLICEAIAALTPLCPDCWQPASSASTANKVCTNYAIKASGELTSYMDWVHDVDHVLARSQRADDALRSARGQCRPEVLLEPEGVRGNPSPSRETGEAPAGRVAFGAVGEVCGSLTTAFDAKNYGNLQEVHSGSVVAVSDAAVLTAAYPLAMRGRADGAELEMGEPDTANAVRTPGGGSSLQSVLTPDLAVRRLTPTECERLMGWPDGWTALRADGTAIADGPRYRMCGNGVVAPVAQWIANRMLTVPAVKNTEPDKDTP